MEILPNWPYFNLVKPRFALKTSTWMSRSSQEVQVVEVPVPVPAPPTPAASPTAAPSAKAEFYWGRGRIWGDIWRRWKLIPYQTESSKKVRIQETVARGIHCVVDAFFKSGGSLPLEIFETRAEKKHGDTLNVDWCIHVLPSKAWIHLGKLLQRQPRSAQMMV